MENILEKTPRSDGAQPENVRLAIQEAVGRPVRAHPGCHHVQPKRFRAGEPLQIELSIERTVESVRLYYRHVNQAERYATAEMQMTEKGYRATIPADYTNSLYPLQYYFELKEKPETAWLYLGFTEKLANQPYFVVRKG